MDPDLAQHYLIFFQSSCKGTYVAKISAFLARSHSLGSFQIYTYGSVISERARTNCHSELKLLILVKMSGNEKNF